MLLSDPSLCHLQQAITDHSSILEDLQTYPNSKQVIDLYNSLSLLLNQTLELIEQQNQELIKSAQWVAEEQKQYRRFEDLDCKLASAHERIEQAWQSLWEVSAEFYPRS
jgi:hypothetical protein